MRAATVAVSALAAALGASGCKWLDSLRPPAGKAEQVAGGQLEPREANQFVAYLNNQAQYLQSVRYNDVSLKASDPNGDLPRLSDSTLACARPRYFRLKAGHRLTNGDEVDVGSNPQEFWMYVKRPEQTFVYCSHDDFARGKANLPVPFEPDWVLEALGMNTYDPNRPYQLDVNQKERVYTLTFDAQTPQGQAIKKVIVFAGDRADAARPQVMRHTVLDAAGKVVASADVREVKAVPAGTDRATGQPVTVQVPTRVVLEWPQQKFKMDLTLGQVKVNEEMNTQQFDYFFRRPEIKGASPINLANATFRPSSYRGATPEGGRPRLFGGW